jgi:IS5 family transposase
VIRFAASTDQDHDSSHGGGASRSADQQIGSYTSQSNQGSLLIDASCAPADIRHPTDLSLLNEARELTEALIDAMHSQVRDTFGHKPRTHRKQARQQFLAVAKKKRPRINKIRRAIRQQLGHLRRNLASIDALTARAASLLAAGRYAYQKLLVVSELVRQQTILDQSDSRSIPVSGDIENWTRGDTKTEPPWSLRSNTG